jgi:hypothetical protein
MNNNSFKVEGIIFHTGDKIICNINANKITDAKLYIAYGSKAYICQNVIDGTRASDTLGYCYSWVFNLYDAFSHLARQGVYNLKKAKIECFEGIIEAAYPKR